MASRRYLGATPHLGLKDKKQNFVFNASRDWKPLEMFLDVEWGDVGVKGKSGNESFESQPRSVQSVGEIAGS